MRTLQQVLNFLMMLLFVFAAVLQYNDDDMLRWAAIYLVAAACCVAAMVGKLKWWVSALVAAFCVGWSVIYMLRGAAGMPVGEMFAEWEMKNQQIVEEREMFGLLIIAAWMIVLAVSARRKSATAGQAS
jgi:hypothetical protein